MLNKGHNELVIQRHQNASVSFMDLAQRVILGNSLLQRDTTECVADKVLGVQENLNAVATVRDLLAAIMMWALIASPVYGGPWLYSRAGARHPAGLPCHAPDGGKHWEGLLLQLQIIGWFNQITVFSTPCAPPCGAPIKAATACEGVLLIINLICITPFGLLFSSIKRMSLKNATRESTRPANTPSDIYRLEYSALRCH